MDEDIRKVALAVAAIAVPSPFAAVFQPAKLYPVLASVPLLLRAVTVSPLEYVATSMGTDPDVAVLVS